MRFRVLGPVEAAADGHELQLGSGRQRALLALLLLHGNEVVSADRLIDELWNGQPPETAAKVLQGYISRLRRALPPDTILTRGSGYVLGVEDTDALEFERLLDRAADEEPRGAVSTLGEALALWRGRPYADVEYEPWAQGEIARLEELRLFALEERIDAELQLGESSRLVPELEALVGEHPLRERLRLQLMLALYRSGRQTEALDVYTDARRRLVDELGIEPGPELQDLQRRILAHDPELGPVPRPRPLATAARRAPWLVAVGVLLLAGAASAAVLLLARGGGATIGPNSVVLLGGRKLAVGAQIAVGSRPSQFASGAGALWVLNSDDSTVSEIDPAARRRVETFAAGVRPVGIAAGAGAVWVENGPAATRSQIAGTMLPSSLTRIDPATRTAVGTVALPTSTFDSAYGRLPGTRLIVAGAGSLWTVAARSRLIRLDARTGRTLRRYPFSADSLAFGGGELWIVEQGNQVMRLDPRTNRIDLTYPLAAGPGIAYGFGSAWVADPVQDLVWRITPGRPVRARSIAVPGVATAVAVSDGAVWASSVLNDEVIRIDPGSNRVTAAVHVTAPQDLAPAPNGVWVTTGPAPASSGPLPASSCGPLVYPGPGSPRFIVASDLPLQGSAGASTRPIERGTEQLIRERGFRAGKFTIGYQSCDDSTVQSGGFDWAKCIANARAYGSDLDVIGVVGTYNSGCAYLEIPILNRARNGPLAMVSPLNTDGSLTIPSITGVPGVNLYPTRVRNYARVIGADQIQMAADAALEKQLGVTHVAVLDDGGASAVQSDRWFSYAAHRLGLSTTRIPWDLAHPEPAQIVARVRDARPDGVFVAAGGLPEGAPVVAALRAALPKRVPVVVTDWFSGYPAFWHFAGRSIDGVYASIAGRPDSSLPPAGRRFVARVGSRLSYTAAYGGAATEVLLDAIARSNGTRASVARGLAQTHIPGGILGDVQINANGDPVTAPVTIFRLRRGARNNTGVRDNQDAVVDRVIVPPPRVIPGDVSLTHPQRNGN